MDAILVIGGPGFCHWRWTLFSCGYYADGTKFNLCEKRDIGIFENYAESRLPGHLRTRFTEI